MGGIVRKSGWKLFLVALVAATGITFWFRRSSQPDVDHREIAILDANPAALAAHHQGEAAFNRGALAEAALGFRTAARLEPRSALAWYNLGTAESQLGHGPEAVEALRHSVQLEPRWSAGWQSLASAQADTNDFPGAQTAARKAVELDARAPQAWLVKGHVEFLRSDQKAAEESVRKALSLDSKNPAAWLSLGDVLLKSTGSQSATEAVAAFRKSVELRPAAYTWQRLGEAQSRAGNASDAVTSLRNAVRLAPTDAAAAYALTQALQAAGDTAEATREAVRARQLQEARYRLIALERRAVQAPEDERLQLELGKERRKQGDRRGAMQALQKALELNPENATARHLLAELEAGAPDAKASP